MKNKEKNEKGIALLITLFAIMIMVFLAVEVGYNTAVELKVGAAQIDRLKAYYLAKSGVELSMLRINAYKTILSKFGSQLGASKGDLDMIWSFPFAWPPVLPEDTSDLDKEEVKAAVKKSTIDGAFTTTITAESGKININDLGSPSQPLVTAVYTQLVNLIQDRMNADDDWGQNHQNLRPQEIINNIADWIGKSNQSKDGLDKMAPYINSTPQIKPAYRGLKTIEELHQIAGVTDDVYNILAPAVTVYGEKGINVNYASSGVLQSIDKQITPDIAKAIIEHRSSAGAADTTKGPFPNEQGFDTFLQSQGVNMQNFNKNPVIPLLYSSVASFRIKSTGVFGKAQREIVAIAYDFDTVKGELTQAISQASPPASPVNSVSSGVTAGQSATPTPTTTATSSASGGPPILVFWQEH